MRNDRLVQIRGSLSQTAFAAKLGIHKNTLARYESGEREPDGGMLKALRQLGYSADWVLTGIGPERLDQAPKSQAVSLDPKKLQAAIETVEEGLAVTGRTATAAGKAALVAKVYEVFQSEEAGPMATAQILRLIRTGT